MCRLFGFRSVILSQVHSSLLSADNALQVQGHQNQDGWGVAYYLANTPHLIKSEQSAVDNYIFTKVSGVVSSQTVIAHIRKSTIGNKNILNTHPFQYGKWIFAHNGNIKNFKHYKDQIFERVSPELQKFVLGETDSELIFYFILTHLEKYIDLHATNSCNLNAAKAISEAVAELTSIVGDFSKIDDAGDTETYLTFLLTDGKMMLAHQGGKSLYYSTYKNKCLDRDTCSSFAPECEAESTTGFVNHLIFSSEPISGDNIWIPMNLGEIITIDHQMKFTKLNL